MALRVVNDDPRCRSPEDCRIWAVNKSKRGACTTCVQLWNLARRKEIAEKLRIREIPSSLAGMFEELRAKVGRGEARRLVLDHAEKRGISV